MEYTNSAKKLKTTTATADSGKNLPEICIIEPFYGGSHKQLIDLIESELKSLENENENENENEKKQLSNYDLYTLSAKKWHWRARVSALHFANAIKKPPDHNYKVLFASSVLNLAELVALRKDLANVKKVVYFHENQLTYPIRQQTTRNKAEIDNKDQRDFQYGYNQILTSLAADKIVFNSNFNKNSFLGSINTFLNKIPDCRIKIDIKIDLEPKCSVAYFPIQIDEQLIGDIVAETTLNRMLHHLNFDSYLNRPIRILWSNRWEHDKNPEEFFDTLIKLKEANVSFQLSVLGEQFTDVPEIFEKSKSILKENILDWGYMPSKRDYYKVLSQCDLIVSTSLHEFFGVSIIEACLLGVYPLVPKRLVYPELYPNECLYSTQAQLIKKLKFICNRPKQFRILRQTNALKQQQQPPSTTKGLLNKQHYNNGSMSSLSTSSSSSSLSLSSSEVSELIDKVNYFHRFKWSSLKHEFLNLFSI